MNARTRTELLKTEPKRDTVVFECGAGGSHKRASQSDRAVNRLNSKDENPVIHHLDRLQGQLSDQLESLNTVMAAMQRISSIMDRMAKKNCKLNSGAALVAPERK